MAKEDRTWVHPNAIRRGDPDHSGRCPHYFRHWEHLTLKMDDYRFVQWAASHNANQEPEDPAFDAAATKLSEHGWEALGKDEREVFANHQMKQIGADTLQEGFSLEGWGRLEGDIGRQKITAFAVANDPAWRPSDFDESYEKTFSKLRVSVRSAQEEHPGSMWVWDESMREISRDDEITDEEDTLYVQFYMLPDKLKALARDVAAQPTRPTLTINAQGLMFRDEVEAALSELWHPREYFLIYDHAHRAILNSIQFDLQTGKIQTQLPKDGTDDDGIAPMIERAGQHLPPVQIATQAFINDLRELKHAVWILAAAIVLAALII